MRTLFEIMEDVSTGKMPTHKECYYALKVYKDMFNLEHLKLRKVLQRDKPSPEFLRNMEMETSFKMYKGALNRSPKDWLGE